jgi:hypothetical protein
MMTYKIIFGLEHMSSCLSEHRKNPAAFFSAIFLIHLFTCVYIVWATSPPYLLHAPSPHHPPHFQAEPVLPISLILLKRKYKQ